MSAWIDQLFKSKIAKRGGVVRRKLSSCLPSIAMHRNRRSRRSARSVATTLSSTAING